MTLSRVFVGVIIHSTGLNDLRVLDPGVIGVRSDGTIAFISRVDAVNTLEDFAKAWSFTIDQVTKLKSTQYLIPGFIDTHIHAPQYVFTGTGTDLPLLEWLKKYTFPRESAFEDVHYARAAYTRAVNRSARCGTTTACYYATIHLPATKILVDVIANLGQRALVGKVTMDRNAPDYYIETLETAKSDIQEFVNHVLAMNNPLIKPVLTPRFVPNCTTEMMQFLGDLAKEKGGLHIQSHLCESKAEVQWVKELHPSIENYASIYHKFGLLQDRCVMAHCVHLSPQERLLMKTSGAGVSHCPLSNFSLCSGVANVRQMLTEGIKVGLGTDVAGGYSASILDSLRQAIIASKVITVRHREDGAEGALPEPLSFAEAFYLATLGGANVLGLNDSLGNFETGKQFDALLIDLEGAMWAENTIRVEGEAKQTFIDIFPHDDILSSFEKFLFLGDDRNIAEVWVGGKKLNFS